jgi:hypothetical protein
VVNFDLVHKGSPLSYVMPNTTTGSSESPVMSCEMLLAIAGAAVAPDDLRPVARVDRVALPERSGRRLGGRTARIKDSSSWRQQSAAVRVFDPAHVS